MSVEEHDLNIEGPGFVAAVCIRDNWEEMSIDERDWCVRVVCSEVEREGNHWNQLARMQKDCNSADRPCAWVLPLLIEKSLSEEKRTLVYRTFVIALTHAIDEVRLYTAIGIGEKLWMIDRDLVLRCVNALATEATLVQQAIEAEVHRPDEDQRQADEIEQEVALFVRQRFSETNAISDDAYKSMDPTKGFGAEANGRILSILGKAPTENISIEAFERLAPILIGWWNRDNDRYRNRKQDRFERDSETELKLIQLFEYFLLQTTTADATRIIKPIVDAIDRHPNEVCRILIGLIKFEDRQPNTPQFWSLWQQFADGVRRATWLARIDDERAIGREMISAIFLSTGWKEEIRHWRSLEGYVEHVHSLFVDLPASSTVLDNYLGFLYHVGEHSLPGAFIRISERIKQGDPRQMLKKMNSVSLLEILLQRFVYSKPLELKRQDNLMEATLFLLDLLVDNGSSAAFRMRDDFVTPLSIS